MRKKALLGGLLILTATLFTQQSCRKNEVDKDTQSSIDYSVAESGYSGVLPVINQIGIDEDGVNRTGSSCATITVAAGDTANFPNQPVTLRIDYGTGCSDFDGRIRSGILLATFNDKFSETGASVVVELMDYRVNGIQYKGTMTLRNNGNDSYSSAVADGECLASDWKILYDGESSVSWINGLSTPDDPSDDVFEYTNDSEITNREGKKSVIETISPLIKRNDCKYIQRGILNVTPEGLATRSFDFGNTGCDNLAQITINGNTFQFELK